MKRAVCGFVCACYVAVSVPFTSFASTVDLADWRSLASASNAVSSSVSEIYLESDIATASNSVSAVSAVSDEITTDDYYDDQISLTSSSGSSVVSYTNTVDLTACRLELQYYDEDQKDDYYQSKCDSSGYVSIADNGYVDTIRYLNFIINKDALPSSAGTYTMGVTFRSNTGGFTYSSMSIRSRYSTTNVSNGYTTGQDIDFQQLSGDFSFQITIDITSATNALYVRMYTSGLELPYGGYFSVRFEHTTDTADYTTVDSSYYSADDATYDTASNTAAIVESNNAIYDTLQELIQHISDQLAALWNQMYNYIHLEDMANADANADKIVNALGDEITVQIENDNQIASDIMDNDDKNTEELAYGYDSSTNDDTNRGFSSSTSSYDDAESEIFDSVSGYLEDFSYDDYSFSLFDNSVLASIRWVSDEFMQVFNGMGSFNVPITASLCLIVVTTLIGYYRIRGGG